MLDFIEHTTAAAACYAVEQSVELVMINIKIL